MSERRYHVLHQTAYRYEAPVTLSYQSLHLTPRELPWQRIESHAVKVDPAPTRRRDGHDAFGNPIVDVALEGPHEVLEIVAESVVTVGRRPVPEPHATPPWETVRDALAFRAGWRPPAAVIEATQFLFESTHVRVKRELGQWAQASFAPGLPVLAGAMALMKRIHAEFRFDPRATTVSTPVMTVFQDRRGVCQDFSHFMVSCLRSLGLAARYVSGYLLTTPPPGKERLIGADASHAWVALFVPEAGWIELDPTNGLLPGTAHVTLGWGRDFADVTPLRGVILGGGEQELDVAVTVMPEEEYARRVAG